MSPTKLKEFKRRAKSAYVAWEMADGNAWEVDDQYAWEKANIAIIIRDRTQAEYEVALQDYKNTDQNKSVF